MAAWLSRGGVDPLRLVTLGPAGFAAYARLRYVPDPEGPGLSEADVQLPDGHLSDIDQARIVLDALAPYTGTAETCFFCIWEGYAGSFLSPELTPGPMVELPHRKYVLFGGALGDIHRWGAWSDGEFCPPPAFVWPADRRWCFTSDVDPHWAGIGATGPAIDALVARTDVDVVTAAPDRTPPAYDS